MIAILLGYLTAISGFPVTLCLVEFGHGNMSHTAFSDIFPSSVFFLTVLVGIAAVCLPYYFAKSMREVIYNPKYYTKEGIEGHQEKQ